MTKHQIASIISERTGISINVVTSIIDEFIVEIKESVSNDDSVTLRGFGTFKKKYCNDKNFHASPGRYIYIPSHYVPALKFSKDIINLVKNISLKD